MTPATILTVALMQPTLIAKPFHREGWIYEEKVDGWRMGVYKADRSVVGSTSSESCCRRG